MKTYCRGLRIDREAVWQAYRDWLSGRSGRRNGWRVDAEFGSAAALVDEIRSELAARSLSLAPIRRYRHVEPTNGKVRVIGMESVKQQVCDHLAVACIRPLLDARLGYYQCAGVRGKGQRLCRTALRRWSREGGWFAKADVRKCYPSLNPEVAMGILRRRVGSADVLYLCEELLATYGEGMEVGSYLSLCLVNLALSEGYHHVESLGKRRRGRWSPLVRHQLWHMDDVLLMGPRKADVRAAMRSLAAFLRRELGLELKPWKVCRVSASERPDMGGWVAQRGRVALRSGVFLRGRRAFRQFGRHPTLPAARRACSYWGWFCHADLDRVVASAHMHRTQRRAASLVGRWARLEEGHAEDAVGRAA